MRSGFPNQVCVDRVSLRDFAFGFYGPIAPRNHDRPSGNASFSRCSRGDERAWRCVPDEGCVLRCVNHRKQGDEKCLKMLEERCALLSHSGLSPIPMLVRSALPWEKTRIFKTSAGMLNLDSCFLVSKILLSGDILIPGT